MADFRRWVTALAVLALFAGLAAAQTGSAGTTPLVCNSVAQVTPTLRAEGVTELVGDIVITCSGGSPLPNSTATNGVVIPQANLVVSLTAPVTSRLRSSTSGSSEALLLIDEPNSGLTAPVPGFGPAAPLNVCSSVSGGCLEYVNTVASTSLGNIQVATDTIGGTTPGKNVFEGVVSGNQVSFNGIPILAPVTSGINRVYRITNIRVNASGATGGVAGGIVPIQAFLSATGSTSLPVSNAALTVGFVQTSLSLSVTNDRQGGTPTSTATNVFTQCNSPSDITTTTSGTAVSLGKVALLNFTENFPSAFKTRVGINPVTGAYTSPIVGTNSAPLSFLGTSGTAAGYTQNVPGTLYTSESGFVLDVPQTNASPFVAGLADSGTRFQAVFNNIPTGATIYVSRYTMTSFTTASASNIGLPPATGSTQGQVAAFTTGGAAGAFSDFSASKAQFIGGSPVEVIPLTATNGSATAVWEVLNTNTSQNETFSFGVYIAFTPNLTSNQPTPGSAATVTLSYAPLTTSSTTWIPRFIAGAASTAQPLVTINKCSTVLLFPYITAAAGFDTGIAISNTSMDPLTPATQQSTGSCALNFFGVNQPTGTVPPLGPIPAGNGSDPTKFAFMLSTVAPNFTGYMFAVCDFQFAHGFAFISDVGTRNLAMGYLALVVNPGGQINRPSKPSGESFGQ